MNPKQAVEYKEQPVLTEAEIQADLEGVIDPGQKILLELGRMQLEGVVTEMTEEGIVVKVNAEKKSLLRKSGESVAVKLWQEKYIYNFETTFLQEGKDGDLLVLKYPKLLSKEERRSFFRWKAWGDYQVYWADVHNTIPWWLRYGRKKLLDIPPGYRGVPVVDMSAGGVSIVSNQEIRSKKKLWLIIPLGDMALDAEVSIVRSKKAEDKFIYSLKFENLREADKDRIVAFVFRKQVALKELERASQGNGTSGEDDIRYDLRDLSKDLNVEYRVEGGHYDVKHSLYKKGPVKDLGIGGIAFYGKEELLEGSEIMLKLKLDSRTELVLMGIVKRCSSSEDGFLTAAEFIGADRNARKAIYYYLMKKAE